MLKVFILFTMFFMNTFVFAMQNLEIDQANQIALNNRLVNAPGNVLFFIDENNDVLVIGSDKRAQRFSEFLKVNEITLQNLTDEDVENSKYTQIVSNFDCFTLLLDSLGRVWIYKKTDAANNTKPELKILEQIRKATFLAASLIDGLVILEDGGFWTIEFDFRHFKESLQKYDPRLQGASNNYVAGAVGSSHRLLLDNKGVVWSYGPQNDKGQLGFKTLSFNRYSPNKIELDVKVQAVAAAANYSLLLDINGDIWFFGKMIGRGLRSAYVPTKLEFETKFKAMKAESMYAIFQGIDNRIWFVGSLPNQSAGTGNRLKILDGMPTALSVAHLPKSLVFLENESSMYTLVPNNKGPADKELIWTKPMGEEPQVIGQVEGVVPQNTPVSYAPNYAKGNQKVEPVEREYKLNANDEPKQLDDFKEPTFLERIFSLLKNIFSFAWLFGGSAN